VINDANSNLKVAVKDGFVYLEEVQVSGKRQMQIRDFLRGFDIQGDWKV